MGARLVGRSAGYILDRPFPIAPHSGLSQNAVRALIRSWKSRSLPHQFKGPL
jgi:hypothetical protein